MECGEEEERVRRLVPSDAVDLIQTEVRLRPGYSECIIYDFNT